MNEAIAIILGIGFWVCCALCTIAILTYVWIVIQYYRWDKMDRENVNLTNIVSKAVAETITKLDAEWGEESEEEIDLGGGT